MKTKNILRTFLTAVFVLGTLAMSAQTKIYVHKSDGTADEYLISEVDSISFTAPPVQADYSKLILTEVSGEHKYVEIYNSGTVEIPLRGVRLQRNDGPPSGSEWVGGADAVIPAGAYRLFLFNSFNPATLVDNPAYVGWTVSSGISDQQILKIALVDPSGEPIDIFIRGEAPLPVWGNTDSVTRNRNQSYSRMTDDTWAYAEPTPGAVNGDRVSEIVAPGYLTAMP